MNILSRVQPHLLSQTRPSLHGFGLAGTCLSALEVGGDFYEAVPLSESSLLIVIADVMGKGLPASVFADSLRTLVCALARPGARPSELLREINHLMFEDLSGADMFITVQIAIADLFQRRLDVSNAGHCPMLICDSSGYSRAIAPEGMPLGIQKDACFRQERAQLPFHGAALLYTDGLTEARNPRGNFFGEERLASWLRQAIHDNPAASQLRASLLQQLHLFQEGAEPSDDQTFLILSDETPRSAAPIINVLSAIRTSRCDVSARVQPAERIRQRARIAQTLPSPGRCAA